MIRKYILALIYFSLPYLGFAEGICTDGNLDTSTCQNTISAGEYTTLDTAQGGYQEQGGFFGLKDIPDIKLSSFAQTPNGFLGSSRKKYSGFDLYTPVPVGYFGQYKEVSLVFPSQKIYSDDTDFSLYPLVKPIYDIRNNVNPGGQQGGINGSCLVESPKSIQIETYRKSTYDMLKISWESVPGVKYKVLQVSPEDNIYDVGEKNTFENVLLQTPTKYKYFIVAYSDCNPGVYSDLIQYVYSPNSSLQTGYLTLDASLITFIPPQTLPASQTVYKLFCYLGQELVLSSFLDTNLQFQLDADILKKNLSCEVQYLDDMGKLIITPRFFYYLQQQQIITYADIINILYAEDAQNFYAYFPHLKEMFPEKQVATYQGLALILINSQLGIYMEAADLAYTLLVKNEVIPDIGSQKSIDNESLYEALGYIDHHTQKIQQSIVEYLQNNFEISDKQVLKKFYTALQIKKYLDKTNISPIQKQVFKKCLLLDYCSDTDGFLVFSSTIFSQSDIPTFSYTGINSNYQQLIHALLGAYGYDMKVSKNISSAQFEKFIDILTQAKMTQIHKTNISYFDFYFMYLHIFENDTLEHQVAYLLQKHFDTIIGLYDSDKKEALLSILSNYLAELE